RRLFARTPSGALGQSTLDGGTRLARPFYNTARAACRGLRRRVKPFCNLCDSRWADSKPSEKNLAKTLAVLPISQAWQTLCGRHALNLASPIMTRGGVTATTLGLRGI